MMDRDNLVAILVTEYGSAQEDAVQAVGNAEDFIADMVEAGASDADVAEGIYSNQDFWNFMALEEDAAQKLLRDIFTDAVVLRRDTDG